MDPPLGSSSKGQKMVAMVRRVFHSTCIAVSSYCIVCNLFTMERGSRFVRVQLFNIRGKWNLQLTSNHVAVKCNVHIGVLIITRCFYVHSHQHRLVPFHSKLRLD